MAKKTKRVLIEETLEDLVQKGQCTAAALLKLGTPKSSPLHEFFTWDNDKASHQWRLQEAAEMIRATKFVVWMVEDGKTSQIPRVATADEVKAGVAQKMPLRSFLNCPSGGYASRKAVLGNKKSRVYQIEMKLAELECWCREASDIAELGKVRRGILKLLGEFAK